MRFGESPKILPVALRWRLCIFNEVSFLKGVYELLGGCGKRFVVTRGFQQSGFDTGIIEFNTYTPGQKYCCNRLRRIACKPPT